MKPRLAPGAVFDYASGMRRWFLFLIPALAAAGHPVLQNGLRVEDGGGEVRIAVEVSLRELSVIAGLPPETAPADSGDAARQHAGYVLSHLEVRSNGNPLRGELESMAPPSVIREGPEGPDLTVWTYRIRYPVRGIPARRELSHRMAAECNAPGGEPWKLSYRYRIFRMEGDEIPVNPLKFGNLERGRTISWQPEGSAAGAEPAGPVAVPVPPVEVPAKPAGPPGEYGWSGGPGMAAAAMVLAAAAAVAAVRRRA